MFLFYQKNSRHGTQGWQRRVFVEKPRNSTKTQGHLICVVMGGGQSEDVPRHLWSSRSRWSGCLGPKRDSLYTNRVSVCPAFHKIAAHQSQAAQDRAGEASNRAETVIGDGLRRPGASRLRGGSWRVKDHAPVVVSASHSGLQIPLDDSPGSPSALQGHLADPLDVLQRLDVESINPWPDSGVIRGDGRPGTDRAATPIAPAYNERDGR